MSNRHAIVGVFLGLCLAAVLGCRAPEPGPAAPDVIQRTLAELVEQRRVSVTARGAGMDRISLELHRLDDRVQDVDIPAGTYFVARRAAVQNSIATDTRTVTLNSNGWVFVDVPVAATNLWHARPIAGDTFDIRPRPEADELQRLIPALASHDGAYQVLQAAVWIAGADASYADLGTVVLGDALNSRRAIDETATAQALEICDLAGIDVTRKAVWRDAGRVLQNLPEGRLEHWLRSRLSVHSSADAQE
jgi:hypothetical protein